MAMFASGGMAIRSVYVLAVLLAVGSTPALASNDTVIIVNSLVHANAQAVFTAANASNSSITFPGLTTVANVSNGRLISLDLPITGPEETTVLWAVVVTAHDTTPASPPMVVQGDDMILKRGFQMLIRLEQQRENMTSFDVRNNQSVLIKNNKFHSKVDRAVVLVINDADNTTSRLGLPLFVNATSDNCYKCRPWALEGDQGILFSNNGAYVRVDTNFGYMFDVFVPSTAGRAHRKEEVYLDGRLQQTFDEKGEYVMLCHGRSSHSVDCSLYQTKAGIDTFAPLWHAALALFFIAATLSLALYLNRRYQLLLRLQCRTHDRLVNADLGDTDEFSGSYRGRVPTSDQEASDASTSLQRQRTNLSNEASTPPRGKRQTKRLRSLDTFRGLSLSIMIFVNYEGGRYWFFNHSRWNGLTVADCVFPWFIWIMGTSMVISFNSQRRKGMSKLSMSLKILRRSIILFCIGLFLNNGYDLSHWRIPGVLQRFGVSYLVVGLVDVFAPTLNISKLNPLYDVLAFMPQWIIMVTVVIIHTAITFGMHVPGCPTGYLGPGGIGDHHHYPTCTGGVSGYIDWWIFGKDHMYRHPTCTDTYQCMPYDPEGALGSLTSIFLCFLGTQAGRILVVYDQGIPRIARWIVWGSLLGAAGTGLCGASQNTGLIPINKNLWSLSFILVLGAGAFMLLAVCYILVDVLEIWSGAPFYYPGMNSILVYVGSELLEGYFPFSFKVSSDHSGILASSLVGVSTWLVVAYYLDHIKFYLKI